MREPAKMGFFVPLPSSLYGFTMSLINLLSNTGRVFLLPHSCILTSSALTVMLQYWLQWIYMYSWEELEPTDAYKPLQMLRILNKGA